MRCDVQCAVGTGQNNYTRAGPTFGVWGGGGGGGSKKKTPLGKRGDFSVEIHLITIN